MANKPTTAIDVLEYWPRLNEQLVQLIDYIPDDKMNWSPKPELWNFRGILLHICTGRHGWLGGQIHDGETTPDVIRAGQTRDGLKQELRASWQRLERFLCEPANLSRTYEMQYIGERQPLTGNWLAYHLLEHDIHHRADIFCYLALLDIEHPSVETP